MKSVVIEKPLNHYRVSKPNFVCAFEKNIPLLNWYKRFKQHLFSIGYELKDLDVDNLLFQVKEKEMPTHKIVELKNYEQVTYYLLLEMNDNSTDDYQRYQYYCQYLLELRKSCEVYIDLILIYNTETARAIHKNNLIPSNKLTVLSTSLDEHIFNFNFK